MKRKIIFLLWLSIPLLCAAQGNLSFSYEYDAVGNRVCRKVITLSPPQFASPTPQDSLQVENNELQEFTSQMPFMVPEFAVTEALENVYFVEKLAHVEMKIYPNPTTEIITLQISGWEELKMGVFKLFNLNGQLLQEQTVFSSTTNISLLGLSKGTYILKVQINDCVEEWKIIKQ